MSFYSTLMHVADYGSYIGQNVLGEVFNYTS